MANFRQTSAPASFANGDLWFDSDDGDRMYMAIGGAWVGLGVDTEIDGFTDAAYLLDSDRMLAKRGSGGVDFAASAIVHKDANNVFQLGDHNGIAANGAYLGFGAEFTSGSWRNKNNGLGGAAIRNNGGLLQFLTGSSPGAAGSVFSDFDQASYIDGSKNWHHFGTHFFHGANPSAIWPLDTSQLGVTLAAGAALDFPSFSGLLIVNNNTSGAFATFGCGGGAVVAAHNTNPGGMGAVSFWSAGTAHYYFTNTTGAAAYFTFMALRTRTAA